MEINYDTKKAPITSIKIKQPPISGRFYLTTFVVSNEKDYPYIDYVHIGGSEINKDGSLRSENNIAMDYKRAEELRDALILLIEQRRKK